MRVPVATRTRAGMSIFVNAARVVLLAGCLLIPCRGVWAAQQTRDGRQAVYTSYRDIPGVTAEETAAIADLQKQRASFLFAMPLSAECFLTENGTFGGFSVLFCDWLSKLFGIPFKVQSSTWEGLLAGLQSRQIDFTGEITPTPERQTRYLTTDPIATRAIKVMQKADSPEFTKLSKDGPLRLGFLRDATVRSLLVPFLPQKFTPVPAADYADAYAMLRNGEIDAVFAEGPFEIPVETLEDGIVLRNFFPLVYSKVALSTANPELAPIISVVQKYLRNDDSGMLSAMYRQGIRDYMKNKLRLRLNEVEKNYLLDKRISGEAVAVAMEHDNYPLCFFNERAKEWQGIAVDVLKEIGKLTELRFEPANRPGADRVSLLDMLRRGEAPMTVELVKLTTQSDEFLWSSIPYFSDYYAVLSMADREDIGINRIESLRVGLLSNTTHARAFLDWFPDHGNTVYYPSADAGFDALENGEADLLMGSRNLLLGATHYYERPNFRENLLFQYEYGSFFGFNRDQAVLRAIVDKALPLINTAGIADGWMRRVFDYRGKLARGTMPYLIGISFLLVCVLIMLTVLHVQKRETGRRLEAEVRERTRELEVQTRQAQVASQAKSDFLSSMSHEIRTPMNAIIGIADLMRTDNLDETQREYLAGIKKTSGSLLNIINDILDFSKIEAGKMTLVRTHYNLFALFDNIRSITEFFAAEKALRLECGIDENLPRLLYGDEGRVRQIVMNLVSNAVKYTRKGHVSLRFRRTVKNEREYLSITVEDTGIGIRQEDFPRLFESFEQLDKNKNRGIAGTGLGLAVTKRLVDLMDGELSFASEYGKGSEFTVLLPLAEGDPLKAEITKLRKRCTVSPDARILVVDDNALNLTVAQGFLARHGVRAETAAGGEEAVEKIRSTRYDLVFMDHMMPDVDGIEAVRRIRAIPGDSYAALPVVALSANAVLEVRDQFFQAGMNGFIAKPIDADDLNTALVRWLPAEKILAEEEEDAAAKRVDDDGPAGDEYDETLLRLQDIDDLDIAAGLARTAGDRRTYTDILRRFCAGLDRDIADIRAFMEKGEWKAYSIRLHSLKSVFANFGNRRMTERAFALESASANGDTAACLQGTPGFCGEMEAFRAQLLAAGLVQPGEPVAGTSIAGGELALKLKILEQACLDCNADEANRVAGELRGVTLDTATDALLMNISGLVESFDYDDAAAECKTLTAMLDRAGADAGEGSASL